MFSFMAETVGFFFTADDRGEQVITYGIGRHRVRMVQPHLKFVGGHAHHKFHQPAEIVREEHTMSESKAPSSDRATSDEPSSSSGRPSDIGVARPSPAGQSSSSSASSEDVARHGLDPSIHRTDDHSATDSKEDDEKKHKRIMANRRSARASRERRIKYTRDLEKTVDDVTAQNAGLVRQNEILVQEVRILSQEVAMYRNAVGSLPRSDAFSSARWPGPAVAVGGASTSSLGFPMGQHLSSLVNQQSAFPSSMGMPSSTRQHGAAGMFSAAVGSGLTGLERNQMLYRGNVPGSGVSTGSQKGTSPSTLVGGAPRAPIPDGELELLAARQQQERQSSRNASLQEELGRQQFERKQQPPKYERDGGGGGKKK